MNIHYLTPAEQAIKVRELAELQKDPDYMIRVTFLKDAEGWYADVPNHTRGQNSMVMGADRIVEKFAQGDNRVVVGFRTVDPSADDHRKPICHLKRVAHFDGGAEYVSFGLGAIPGLAFLCDVLHSVCGEHAKDIYVYEINHSRI